MERVAIVPLLSFEVSGLLRLGWSGSMEEAGINLVLVKSVAARDDCGVCSVAAAAV